jgi:uncharacterized membrane protein
VLPVLAWYLILTLVGVAAAPLAVWLLGALPARGLLLARPLGVLIFGYLFWLLWSVGLLPNDAGGAWIALLLTAALSLAAWHFVRGEGPATFALSSRERMALLIGEALFLVAFAAWAFVRSHDPSADHTEQPMDLMFMSSLWASPTWPPQDAWLSGYPIAYYYFGYWLLTAVGRLAGTPPEIAYTVGQAAWFGLLASGSYGLAWMLLRLPRTGMMLGGVASTLGALLAAVAVAMAGNVQWLLEYLHAQGVNVARLAAWAQVRGFPEGVPQSGRWFIGNEWWWWRTSRVLADAGSAGGHQEVITEFPAFSYVLGDNHPHVLGMPIVLLLLALALAWYWRGAPDNTTAPLEAEGEPAQDEAEESGDANGGASGGDLAPHEALDTAEADRAWPERKVPDTEAPSGPPPDPTSPPARRRRALPPLLLAVTTLAVGSLIFVNTWDFPAYWGLLTLAVYGGAQGNTATRVRTAALFAAISLAGSLLLMAPYLITAQSQAGGIALNFFNPTRLPQFLWVSLAGLLGAGALILLAWRERAPRGGTWLLLTLATTVLPLALLAGSFLLVRDQPAFVASNPLAEGVASLTAVVLGRWRSGVWTLLLAGVLLATLAALWLAAGGRAAPADAEGKQVRVSASVTPFVLLLAAVALLLYWAPEIFFLRDNFGWRMNTIFKFYYQAWLLLAIAGAWSITHALAAARREPVAALVATPALLLILVGALFLPAGARAKTNGFTGPSTLDATAWLEVAGPGQREAARWLSDNSPRDAIIAEAVGDSYRGDLNRVSTLSGRPTLLGWRGHQRQWRGDAYGEMSAGREEALRSIYRLARADELPALLATWGVEYVVVGPAERQTYEMNDQDEARIGSVLPLVYESGDVRIYSAPGP